MKKYGKNLNTREMLIRIGYIKKYRIATERMSTYEQGWVKIQNHNFFHPSSVDILLVHLLLFYLISNKPK